MSALRQSSRIPDLLALAAYASIVIALGLVYLGQARDAGGGQPLMPVDDAYIHFQYARQAAGGQPFVYNPGQGPTSGATSLLYPFVLAAGIGLGYSGLDLGYWAVLVGGCALVASAATVRAIARSAGLPRWQSDLMGLAMASSGAFAWHAFSGMETALTVALTLLTFYMFERQRTGGFVVSASVLAALRPEASIMAVIAVVLYALRSLRADGLRRRQALLFIPFASAAVQPLLNLALTGTANAAGSQAKSLLSVVPFDAGYVVGRITENFARAWMGFLSGFDDSGGWSLVPLFGVVAVVGAYRLWRLRSHSFALVLSWLIVTFAAISTLDTAFWHFKRYHMPLLALTFPLAAHGLMLMSSRVWLRSALVAGFLIANVPINLNYMNYHGDNVASVAAQPLAMSRWIAANLPEDSLIAVHDVGLIRFLSGRRTLDMVGLTTEGAADSWRNGPGAVGEYLVNAPARPDYIAAYTAARGLNYLADSLYGRELAGFMHDYDPETNVALGGNFQGVFRPTWEGAAAAQQPRVEGVRTYLTGFELSDMLNVADLASERAHKYRWENVSRFDGFASEMYLFETPGCAAACRVLDGGRRFNGIESFELTGVANRDHILVSRYHAPAGGTIRIVINDEYVTTRTLPVIPGQFVEIPTLIPASALARVDASSPPAIAVRIEVLPEGALIYPYRHWLYAGEYQIQPELESPIVFQRGEIGLDIRPALEGNVLNVELTWAAGSGATGDYVAFVHVYAEIGAPPVVQSDKRPGDGALPPGAWLPGTFSERIMLDLSGVDTESCTIAVGLYDPATLERLVPDEAAGFRVDAGRVLLPCRRSQN